MVLHPQTHQHRNRVEYHRSLRTRHILAPTSTTTLHRHTHHRTSSPLLPQPQPTNTPPNHTHQPNTKTNTALFHGTTPPTPSHRRHAPRGTDSYEGGGGRNDGEGDYTRCDCEGGGSEGYCEEAEGEEGG